MFNILYLSANGLIFQSSSALLVGQHCAVIILSLLLNINEKSPTCENVNTPSACTGFTHVCESILYTHSALKAVSLVRPCLSFLSVNQCRLPPPLPHLHKQPVWALTCQRKRKSMVPLSFHWQARQQHGNQSSQAMAD